MPQTKAYTAKRTLHLDCGHTIQTGESFVATTVYTCQQENAWPLRILMACLGVIRKKHTEESKAPAASKTKA